MNYLFTFVSTHHAMKAESYLKKDNLPYRLRMKPRTVSADCGLALDVKPEHITRVIASFDRRGLSGFTVYLPGDEPGDWRNVPVEDIRGSAEMGSEGDENRLSGP